MRITIDIDAKSLQRIQKLTGQRKKSPAVSEALSTYLREQDRRALIKRALSGKTDYLTSNEELEARDVYEAH
jgi:Arc/MetJ family transcription regulator